MPQDIFIIHGGNTFDRYEDYVVSLKIKEMSREKLQRMDWKMNLGKNLGPAFEVFVPEMPSKQNAKYAEWKIWFERLIPLMHEPVILIGHSLGGIFLAKYLSEELCSKKIRATLLVAAPFHTQAETFSAAHESSLADFILPDHVTRLREQAGELFLYHSPDDEVVPFVSLEKYRQALPGAHIRVIEQRGHFNQDSFFELEQDIRSFQLEG